MSTDHCWKTGVCLSAYYIATAVLVVRFEVSARQQVYTPQCVSCVCQLKSYISLYKLAPHLLIPPAAFLCFTKLYDSLSKSFHCPSALHVPVQFHWMPTIFHTLVYRLATCGVSCGCWSRWAFFDLVHMWSFQILFRWSVLISLFGLIYCTHHWGVS
jgi:hypothetical protein